MQNLVYEWVDFAQNLAQNWADWYMIGLEFLKFVLPGLDLFFRAGLEIPESWYFR